MTDYSNPDWLCIHKVVHHQCKKCAFPQLDHPADPQQEMTSLREIKFKLDALLEGTKHLTSAIQAGCEAGRMQLEHDTERFKATEQRLATIEAGLDKLLQSHAALERKKIDGMDTVQDAIRFEAERDRKELLGLCTALGAQIAGGFDGTVDGYNRVAEEIALLRQWQSSPPMLKMRTKRRSKKR